MTILSVLLVLGLAVAGGLAFLVLEQARWDRRNRRVLCMTCGNYHARHADHR
ncbi:hypothetical protein ACQ86D_27945 [Streptomyces galilaeus]